MKANIEISDNNLTAIANLLNTLLADEHVIYIKTRNAHWNVQGRNFGGLHEFFEKQYDELAEMIDEVAERVRALGHFALGTMKDYLGVTRMSEQNENFSNQEQIIQTLLDDHETIIRILRNDANEILDKYKDLGTADFCTGLMEQHEKMAWMLRAHIA